MEILLFHSLVYTVVYCAPKGIWERIIRKINRVDIWMGELVMSILAFKRSE